METSELLGKLLLHFRKYYYTTHTSERAIQIPTYILIKSITRRRNPFYGLHCILGE